jgi:nucleotide-binding universal stress UspA family protein
VDQSADQRAEEETVMAPGKPDGTGRIVVGVDGSPWSVEALSWAARQADLTGSSLEIVMAWQWPTSLGWSVPVPDDFDPEEDVRKSLTSIADNVQADYPGLSVLPRIVGGHPAPILVEASEGADLLVVGSRGHGEFVGMLIGSVSEYCATNARCPVLIYRSGA